MGTLLLLGNFQHQRTFLASLSGWRLVVCHSLEAFQGLWMQVKPDAVVVSYQAMTPVLNRFLGEGNSRFSGVRWVLLSSQEVAHPIPASENYLFLQGTYGPSSKALLERWLADSRFSERRSGRQTCRGGARLKDSDYSRQQRGRKFYGEVHDISAQGARLSFPGGLPPAESDYFEVTLKDSQGQTRSYHAQVRWQRPGSQGGTEIGVQLLAEASL